MKKKPAKDVEQSLGLVKFISWSSLAFILLINLFFSIFLSNYGRQEVLSKQKEFARLLAENLNHQIYQRFTLPTVLGFGRVELQQPAQYEQLEKVITSTIHSFHVMELRIYDFEKRISYATEKDLIGQTGYTGEAVVEAMDQGKSDFQVLSRSGALGGILDFNPQAGSVILRTIYPLRTERPLSSGAPAGVIMGVLEITQDITDDYQKIVNFQRIIILSAGASSLALFFSLSMIMRRAGRINAQRIQEREALERELQQQEKLAGMGRVVAGIAHEIRNPLGIIRSSAELLLKKAQGTNDPNSRILAAIFDESKRLSKTVGDFLDYARPKTPRQDDVNLAAILDQVLAFLESKCEEHGVTVTRGYDADIPVKGDKDLLYRAVYNIVGNALDAMSQAPRPEGHHLSLQVSQPADGTLLTIADTGPGFDPRHKDKAPDPFFTTKDTGTGLGLAIVKNILESHNATLTLDNTETGGAKVEMLFPRP